MTTILSVSALVLEGAHALAAPGATDLAAVRAGMTTWPGDGVGALAPFALARGRPSPSQVAPTASSLAPEAGPTTGGTTVAITGTHFVPRDTTVTFADMTVAREQATVDDGGTSLTFTMPQHSAEPVAVVVTTSAGSTYPLTFTYVGPLEAGSQPPVSA